jgi:hypothetical protein
VIRKFGVICRGLSRSTRRGGRRTPLIASGLRRIPDFATANVTSSWWACPLVKHDESLCVSKAEGKTAEVKKNRC